jgi:WD40 repeat protein
MLACKNGHTECVDALMKASANPQAGLVWAARNGHSGCIAPYSLASLPPQIRSAVLRPQLAHLLGLTYEDVPFAALRDNDEPDYEERRALLIPELAVCRGHQCNVTSCVTADNKIISGSEDYTVRVWDMKGNQLAVCRDHQGWVLSVCVTADNKIVSGSNDKTVRVWDMQGNKLAVCRGHEDYVTSVFVTRDNKIVSGSDDKTVRVWDMQGKQLAVCRGHQKCVSSVCVTADNKIVSGSDDGTVRVWDMQGKQLAVCRGHEDPVISVCVTADNKIVSGSYDKTVRVWDIEKLSLLEKALSASSASLEKSGTIWKLIQKYSTGTEDTENFSNELKALIP